MGLWQRMFGRETSDEDAPITLDVEQRKRQLLRLEKALDALVEAMRAGHTTDDPGWRGKVNDYSRLAGEAMNQRRAPTREGILDLVFEVRPVFKGPIPAGYENLEALQAEVLAAAADLRPLLPGEK